MMKKERGFTLIELMVTIAVLVIITMVSVPSYLSVIQGNELKTGTNTVLFVLNEAKNNARLTRQTSTVKLDSSFSVPSTDKQYMLDSFLTNKISLSVDDKAISFLANGLMQTTAGKYPVCIGIRHKKSLNLEYISITRLGLVSRSKTSCI